MLSALQAPQPWFSVQSEFQALLVQGSAQAAEWSSVHSQYIAVGGSPEWDSVVWCRLHRLFKVLQVLTSVCKNGPWDFVLVPYLFKTPNLVPILEGIKQLWLWWSQRCSWIFQRQTSSNGVHTCKNFVLHPAVCAFLAKCFFFFFSFPCLSLLSLPFLHSPHCDCSAKTRLKKMSFLFYCIILPFDLVMLNRMSYNVESAKSVLFSHLCNLLENVKDFLCNTHITKNNKEALHGK